MPKEVYVIDLFCGCGGFSTGARQAGAKVILAVDCWKEALAVHESNHPDTEHLCTTLGGDLDEFASFLTGFIDLNVPSGGHVHLHASPPCQNLSLANSSRDTKIGMELVEWTVELIELLNGSLNTWSIEQVRHPKVRAYFNKRQMYYKVVKMHLYGLCAHRNRIISTSFDANHIWVERDDDLKTFKDSCDAVGYEIPPNITHISNATEHTRNFLRGINEPCFTVTSRSPLLYDGEKERTMPLSIISALQSFPSSYQFDPTRPYSFTRQIIANAFPPMISQLLVHHICSDNPKPLRARNDIGADNDTPVRDRNQWPLP